MRDQWETVWTFNTVQYRVDLQITPDYDLDLSFDEDGETLANLESGLWQSFGSRVIVTHKLTGATLGEDSLWGSIYETPSEFWTAHRTSAPEYRNTLAQKAQRRVICHYFPSMISEAVKAARLEVSKMKSLKLRAA